MEPDNPLRPLFRNVSAIKGIGPKTLPLIESQAFGMFCFISFALHPRQVIDNRADLENDQMHIGGGSAEYSTRSIAFGHTVPAPLVRRVGVFQCTATAQQLATYR